MSNALPFENELIEAFREYGNQLVILSGLSESDEDKAKKDSLTSLIKQRMDQVATEIGAEAEKQGILVSLKTVMVIKGDK